VGRLGRWLGLGDGAPPLVDDLIDAWRAERAHAARLRRDAGCARYPQVADRLRALAEDEERHAAWLAERVAALGGRLPDDPPLDPPGPSQWARAAAAAQAARAKRQRLVERIARWDPDEPDVVALLARIEREDAAALGAYDEVVARSDPQAVD
jgi:rubrerythrin